MTHAQRLRLCVADLAQVFELSPRVGRAELLRKLEEVVRHYFGEPQGVWTHGAEEKPQ